MANFHHYGTAFIRVAAERGLGSALAISLKRLAQSVLSRRSLDPSKIDDAVKNVDRRREHFEVERLTDEVVGLNAQLEHVRQEQRNILGQLGDIADSLRKQSDSLRNLILLTAANKTKLEPSTLKTSVILPVFNRAAMLPAAIQSVLDQRDALFELIVIDDGSDDEIGAAVEPFLVHKAVRLLSIEHSGPPAARNHSLALSSGDIIAYLDSDNVMFPGYLNALSNAYASAPDALCGFAAMLWDDGEAQVHLRHDVFNWQGLFEAKVNLDMNCFSHRARLWRELGGFDVSLTRLSDFDLVLRYTRKSPPLRINALSAHYNHRRDRSRVTYAQPSLPNYVRIRSKYRPSEASLPRVLFYCYDYPQLSESYIETEVGWFSRQGAHIEVFAAEDPGAPGQPTVPVHSGDLEQVVRNLRPDVIHCYWLSMSDAVAGLARELNIPVTVRGHGFEFDMETLRRCSEHDAVNTIYLFPHFQAALSSPCAKIQALPACFSSMRFYPRIQRDRRLVLRVAACLDTKDIELFIRVAARCPEYRFVLALAKVANLPALPAEFCALNEKLGSPVDIRFNIGYDELADLTSRAGIYLHTFGFTTPFGMPISIAESLACGAVPLVRDCPEARGYLKSVALYYRTEADAVSLLQHMLNWTSEEWTLRSNANADFAYQHFADEVVLPRVLENWQQLRAGRVRI